jgi:hypothetical protein
MNQKEKIEYYKNQLTKVIQSHGAESDYTTNAFFKLKAAQMGIENLHEWATEEGERLHQIALDNV